MQIASNTWNDISEVFDQATAENFLKPLATRFNEVFGDIDWGRDFLPMMA